MYIRTITTILICIYLMGCAKLTHYTNQKDLLKSDDNASVVFIDAKQRAVIASNIVFGDEKYRAFCTEPSPDALSTFAASQGFSLTKPDALDIAQFLSISEGAGSIGLRTQSIQLMRDAMYRLCEGYLAGALSDLSWQTLHRRLQSTMVAILAIEQLTGTVRPQNVTLSGSAIVGSAELLSKYTEKTHAARNKVSDSEVAKHNAEVELQSAENMVTEKALIRDNVNQAYTTLADNDPNKSAKKTELDKANEALNKATVERDKKKKAYDDAQTRLDDTKAEFKRYDEARKAALTESGTTSVNVVMSDINKNGPNKVPISEVTEAVSKIVFSTLHLNFAREVCVSVLTDYPVVMTEEERDVFLTCAEYLKNSSDQIKVSNEFNSTFLKTVAEQQTPEEKSNLFRSYPELKREHDSNEAGSTQPMK